MNTLSLAKFGAIHGVTKQAAAKWKDRGLLVIVDGKIDVDASNEKLRVLRTGGAPGAGSVDEAVNQLTNDKELTVRAGETVSGAAERILMATGVEMTIDQAKQMKENYLALLNQLEYDRESGLVVLVSEVAKAVGAEYATVRTKLLGIPSGHAARIHRLKTVAEVQEVLQELITKALEELTRDGGH
jgi:hypothetical protein